MTPRFSLPKKLRNGKGCALVVVMILPQTPRLGSLSTRPPRRTTSKISSKILNFFNLKQGEWIYCGCNRPTDSRATSCPACSIWCPRNWFSEISNLRSRFLKTYFQHRCFHIFPGRGDYFWRVSTANSILSFAVAKCGVSRRLRFAPRFLQLFALNGDGHAAASWLFSL